MEPRTKKYILDTLTARDARRLAKKIADPTNPEAVEKHSDRPKNPDEVFSGSTKEFNRSNNRYGNDQSDSEEKYKEYNDAEPNADQGVGDQYGHPFTFTQEEFDYGKMSEEDFLNEALMDDPAVEMPKMHSALIKKGFKKIQSNTGVHHYEHPDYPNYHFILNKNGYKYRTPAGDVKSMKAVPGNSVNAIKNSLKGLKKIKKSKNEEFELNESNLTPAQMQQRDNLFNNLAKTQGAQLQKKYGNQWKQVLMRIATKRLFGEETKFSLMDELQLAVINEEEPNIEGITLEQAQEIVDFNEELTDENKEKFEEILSDDFETALELIKQAQEL